MEMKSISSAKLFKRMTDASDSFSKGDYQNAFHLWTESLISLPLSAHYAVHTNRGAALERMGMFMEAIEVYDEALRISPTHPEALHNKGVAYRALAASLASTTTTTTSSSSSLSSSPSTPPLIQVPHTMMIAQYRQKAVECFQQSRCISPHFIAPYRGEVDVLCALHQYETALDVAQRALKLVSDKYHHDQNIQYQNNDSLMVDERIGPSTDVAFVLMKCGKYEEAAKMYAFLRDGLHDTSQETRRLHGIVLSQIAVKADKENKKEVAAALYDAALQLEVTENRLFNRAYLLMREGMESCRVINSPTTQSVSPTSSFLASTTTTITSSSNSSLISKLKRSEEMLLSLLSRNPTHMQGLICLGTLYVHSNTYDKAYTILKRTVEEAEVQPAITKMNASSSSSSITTLSPSLPAEVFYNLGLSALHMQHSQEAVKYFAEALDRCPFMTSAKRGLEEAKKRHMDETQKQLSIETVKHAVTELTTTAMVATAVAVSASNELTTLSIMNDVLGPSATAKAFGLMDKTAVEGGGTAVENASNTGETVDSYLKKAVSLHLHQQQQHSSSSSSSSSGGHMTTGDENNLASGATTAIPAHRRMSAIGLHSSLITQLEGIIEVPTLKKSENDADIKHDNNNNNNNNEGRVAENQSILEVAVMSAPSPSVTVVPSERNRSSSSSGGGGNRTPTKPQHSTVMMTEITSSSASAHTSMSEAKQKRACSSTNSHVLLSPAPSPFLEQEAEEEEAEAEAQQKPSPSSLSPSVYYTKRLHQECAENEDTWGEEEEKGHEVEEEEDTTDTSTNNETERESGFQGVCFKLDELLSPGPYPRGIDKTHREIYLSIEEFVNVFGTRKSVWYLLPKWKRNLQKQQVGLF